MSRRARLLTLAAVVIAAAVVVVVLLTRGGDNDGETVRGDTGRGFPLRGSLAGDGDAIDGAVAAWRDQGTEDEEPERKVTALWIGRASDEDVAVLSDFFRVATLTRDEDGWQLEDVRVGRDPYDLCAPTGAGRTVVAPDCGRWRYVPAGSGGVARSVDGLFRPDDDEAQGFVLPDLDLPPSSSSLDLWALNVGRFTVYRDGLPELRQALDRGDAEPLWLAIRSALAALNRLPGHANAPSRRDLKVFWRGALPGDLDGVAITLEENGQAALTLGHAGPGIDAAATTLGAGPEERVVAAGTVDLADRPYLVLAGDGAQTLTAQVGGQRIVRDGPLAFLDLTGRDDEAATLQALPTAP